MILRKYKMVKVKLLNLNNGNWKHVWLCGKAGKVKGTENTSDPRTPAFGIVLHKDFSAKCWHKVELHFVCNLSMLFC